jgi:cytosine/adenosine deaminase-related metal-dependent hydrolase
MQRKYPYWQARIHQIPILIPGFSLHEELELLGPAGLSPMENLQTATLRAAQVLGVDRLFGSVEEGKIANLVLLDANSREDIRNTRKILGAVVAATSWMSCQLIRGYRALRCN